MIEQYKKEMSEVHAPADLIERTREAMKKEEEKLQTEDINQDEIRKTGKTKKVIGKRRTGWVAVAMTAAAAVLLLIAAPFVLQGTATQDKTPALLGQENTSNVQKIENGMSSNNADELTTENEKVKESEIEMTEVSEMPEEFADAREVKLGGHICLLLKMQEGAGWKAYVEKEGKGYLITGIAKDEEHFLQEAQKLILEK